MKTNHVYIVAAVLAVGAVVALVVDNAAKKVDRDAKVGQELLNSESLGSVDHIKISKADKVLELKREGNRWRTGDDLGLPVDAKKVVKLLESLSATKISRMVGEGAEEIKSLEFSTGTSLVISGAGTGLVDVTLGKNREKGGQYLQIGKEAKGFQTDKVISAVPDTEAWELKTLVDVEGSQVRRVNLIPHLSLKKKPVTVQREKAEDTLKVIDLGDGEQEKGGPGTLDRILTAVNFNTRLDKGNAEAATSFETVSRGEVELFSGLKYQVEVGKIGAETPKYFMRVSVDDSGAANLDDNAKDEVALVNRLKESWVYEVASFVGQKFEKGREDYVGPAGTEGDSSQTAEDGADKKKS